MKFGSYMDLSKVIQFCSNQGCITFLHRIMLMSFWRGIQDTQRAGLAHWSADILLYAHRERSDLRGVNLSLSVCFGH